MKYRPLYFGAFVIAAIGVASYFFLGGSETRSISSTAPHKENDQKQITTNSPNIFSTEKTVGDSMAESAKLSRTEIAAAALKSADGLIVKDAYELVRGCNAISRQRDYLQLITSGIFEERHPSISEGEKRKIAAAAQRSLNECEDFLRLGKTRLQELTVALRNRGEKLKSPLFVKPADKREERIQAAILLNSGSQSLIEEGAFQLVRALDEHGETAREKLDEELWDRAILIAGCKLGAYCDRDSAASAVLCWKSRICDKGIEEYWLSELEDEAVATVIKRSGLLVNWIKSESGQDFSSISNYSQPAHAVKLTQ
ncbi:MAG: hypothetical protein QM788_06360 [Roseateles sp.]|uniref:hypothetical protein n=1 Tax=Roseateles sp. TaxID=1971397 RepID=UPI0039E947A3